MALIPPIINVMEKACKNAAKSLVRDFGELENLQISKKDINDFVSSADIKASKSIAYSLENDKPDYLQIDEENFKSSDKEKLNQDKPIFIIDPLDGTLNFMHGIPFFAISIGLAIKKEIIAGTIYNPILNEFFWAHKGSGSWLNNKRIRVSKRRKLEDCIISTGFQIKHQSTLPSYFKEFISIGSKTGIRRLGSAALELSYVADGKIDGFWEHNLNMWDIAAGIILVKEAGGIVTNEKGNSFDLLSDLSLIASNHAIYDEFIKNL
ncbi:MAG: inositol monophosphatase [Pelagibacteraceae bacterium]|nr:inositol monophosphatase [Pelagibacteraceae bacterium]